MEPGEVSSRLGQRRRAGLSVRLAHHLHTFLESQGRDDELRIELLLQEKLWAVEASKLERDLGTFGISNASHQGPGGPGGPGGSSLLPFSTDDTERPVSWRRKGHGLYGCSCVECWGTSILHGSSMPCKLALAQTGALQRSNAPTAMQMVHDIAIGNPTDRREPLAENFRDFREHLNLLLAARANVMAAEASLEILKSEASKASKASKASASEAWPEGETSFTDEIPPGSPRRPDTASIRSAGLKQLMALKVTPRPPSSSQESLKAASEVNPSKDKIIITQRNSVFEEHLSNLNNILSTPVTDETVDAKADETVEPLAQEVGEVDEVERSEITEEFAKSFLQMAEARAETTVETRKADQSQEVTDATETEDMAIPAVPAVPVPDSEEMQAKDAQDAQDAQGSGQTRIREAELQDVEMRPQAAPPQSFVERAAARKQKLLQWQNASDFLRADLTPSSQIWHRAELLMEVDGAKRRLQEQQKHSQILRKWHRAELNSGWLKRRVESAQRLLQLALQPPWEKHEKLERVQKIQRLQSSHPRGRSQIFSLTACVEAVVAAYDAERSRVLDLSEKVPDMESEQTWQAQEAQRAQSRDLTLQALENEVAKSLRSISECRRLLLDLFDKGAEVSSSKQQSQPSSKAEAKDPKEPKVDEKRRSAWAKVYADLLHIDAKDSTTITLKTSQGVAWAKT